MELEGRSAVVAGGAGGLGSATVRRLAALGAGVGVLDPDAGRAAQLVEDIGDACVHVAGDSNDDTVVESAIAAAQRLGIYSIAISATGVVIPSPRLIEADGSLMSKETLLANLELHLLGPFNLARLSAAVFARNEPNADGERGI